MFTTCCISTSLFWVWAARVGLLLGSICRDACQEMSLARLAPGQCPLGGHSGPQQQPNMPHFVASNNNVDDTVNTGITDIIGLCASLRYEVIPGIPLSTQYACVMPATISGNAKRWTGPSLGLYVLSVLKHDDALRKQSRPINIVVASSSREMSEGRR